MVFNLDISKLKSPDGEYDLLSKLGEGNYGAVYKGCHAKSKKVVAIKVVEYDDEDHDDLSIEIDILQRASHPNIVGYYGTYLKFGKIWMVMEMCNGGSLMDIYTACKGMKEEHISFVCGEMLKGLQYMHEKGLIHRDIKGGNVMLTTTGEVKLVDFGVSAITEGKMNRHTFIGTPYWMAPEVIACEKDDNATYNEKSDIWALGITAIEMVDLNPPLSDFHPLRALYLIPSSPPPIAANGKKYSREYNDFVATCLTKDPSKRPSAKEMLKHKFVQPSFQTQKKTSTMRRRRDTLADVVERVGKGLDPNDVPSSPTTEFSSSPKKTLGPGDGSKPSSMLASLVDQLVGGKTTTTEYLKHTEEKLYGVPFHDIEEEDLPAAVMFSDDLRNEDGEFDETAMNGALLANPLFGLDSEEDLKQLAGGDSEEEEEEESKLQTDSLESDVTEERSSEEMKKSLDEVRASEEAPRESLDSSPSTPVTRNLEKQPDTSPTTPVDEPATKFVPVLPVRQRSVATRANERQQNALSKRLTLLRGSTTEEEAAPDGKYLKVLLVKKDFPIDIVCADLFAGKKHVFGTPNGLYQLNKNGHLVRLISNVNFVQVHTLPEFGVMMALVIGKMSTHIRMYSLALIAQAAQKEKAPASFPCMKLKGTKTCQHFSIAQCGKNLFLVACMKKEIILYMWAGFPQNQFMKLREYEVTEKALRCEMISNETSITHIIVQYPSKFSAINVETSKAHTIFESIVGRSVPFSMFPTGTSIFLSYHNFGCRVDGETLQIVGEKLTWQTSPLVVIPLSENRVICLGQRRTDLFSTTTGALLESTSDIEARKIRFLLKQADGRDTVIAAKVTEATSVYIIRPAPQGSNKAGNSDKNAAAAVGKSSEDPPVAS